MPMGGRSSQRKGRNGEIELTKILNAYGIPAEPGQAVSYGATPDVAGIDGVHPEIKRVEKLNVPEAMAQAVRDSEKFRDGVPVLFHRRNRQGWLCTMRLQDWVGFYSHQKAAEPAGESSYQPPGSSNHSGEA